MLVAAAEPKTTVLPVVKLVPKTLTTVPPATGPAAGITPVTVGFRAGVYALPFPVKTAEKVTVTQEIEPMPLPVSGLSTVDQLEPFHEVRPAGVRSVRQKVELTQESEAKTSTVPPMAVGPDHP